MVEASRFRDRAIKLQPVRGTLSPDKLKPSRLRPRIKKMDREREKQALKEKLAKCRKLIAEFPDGVTAKISTIWQQNLSGKSAH